MATRRRKVATAIAVFCAFTCSQIYALAGLPNANPGTPTPQRSITAVLRTRNNLPIKVNGTDVGTGVSILTGAEIETPDSVTAEIDLGDGSVVEIQPNSKIELSYDQDGNVKVKVLRGCVMTKRKVVNVADDKGTSEVTTESGDAVKTDGKKRNAGGCYLPNGKLGGFSTTSAGAGGGGGAGGLSSGEWAAIIAAGAGGTILAIALTRGDDTSPSN